MRKKVAPDVVPPLREYAQRASLPEGKPYRARANARAADSLAAHRASAAATDAANFGRWKTQSTSLAYRPRSIPQAARQFIDPRIAAASLMLIRRDRTSGSQS